MKSIPGYEGKYSATEDGRVWSHHKNKFKGQTENDAGYFVIGVGHVGTVRVHRLVAAAYLGLELRSKTEVDHIDRNRKNNRVDNLRLCNSSEQKSNAHKRSDNTSGFKGVCWDKSYQKWLARVYFMGKAYFCGRHLTAEDAARRYDAKAREVQGEFAVLNFPP